MMKIDIVLPLSVFIITAFSLLLCKKIEDRMKNVLKDRKIKDHEVIFMVIFMGAIVTIISLIPHYAIQILFITALSYILLIFTYLISRKTLLALIPPAIFILAYLLTDSILVINVLTGVFAVAAITLLNSFFSWRTALIFAALLAVMDFVHVFVTGHMSEIADKVNILRLPIMLSFQTFPSTGFYVKLGLGDIFLSGLLSTQTASKYGIKAGLLTAIAISIAFLIFEILKFNLELGVQAFPATIIVLSGWLLGLGPYLLRRKMKILS